MQVRLLKDIWETDRFGGRVGLKVSVLRGNAVPFVKGTIIEMSETSAAKYIEAGNAEAVTEDTANVL